MALTNASWLQQCYKVALVRLGKHLRARREQLDWGFRRTSSMSHMNISTIQRAERGIRALNFETLVRLSDTLQTIICIAPGGNIISYDLPYKIPSRKRVRRKIKHGSHLRKTEDTIGNKDVSPPDS